MAWIAAKWLNYISTPPDPFGELVVNGRAVAALPVVQDRLDPRWPAQVAQYVVLEPDAMVQVNIFDADLFAAHDPIGSCRFTLGGVALGPERRVTSDRCTGDLLAATVVAARAPEPAAIAPGVYQVAVARAALKPTKPDGRPWDAAGFGDPRIRIDVGGRSFACPVNQGQRAGICEPRGLSINVDAQTTISFRVVDADVVFDDFGGMAMAGDFLGKPAGAPLPMSTTGAVAWAEVVLVPAAAEPDAPAAPTAGSAP